MIGWEDDNATVGPVAFAAKKHLLRLIPHILPPDNEDGSLYRLVLDHGDFGIHNMSITLDTPDGNPFVTSVYDWETGSIVPAILSDPSMIVTVDLSLDDDANPVVSRVDDDDTPEDLDLYLSWAKHYYKVLFDVSPGYEDVIRAGKDARHLWFALQAWRGEDPEGYFGKLGTWAEKKLKDLTVL
ncbi:hypothetical protein H0H93_014141 [Arthromyces matolae]|nr:hypothetical protein H0H93_014141 [Arthromyces matolae]